jgi:acyl transferase domain-containing protein/NAD(P)H-dependent flavin oxidoreductase YrpB (nitropropane dioxygenase family)/NAD(P)-dependent dehydrogenase (short-subunit alcohol dehydrogenase family)
MPGDSNRDVSPGVIEWGQRAHGDGCDIAMKSFELVCLSLPGLPSVGVPAAAARAGAIGILDLTMGPRPAQVHRGVEDLSRLARGPFGIRIDCRDGATIEVALAAIGRSVHPPRWVLLAGDGGAVGPHIVRSIKEAGCRVAIEATSLPEARLSAEAGADVIVVRGHEAGGRVGEETSFVLLQRVLDAISIPVWVQGGVGMHTAAACYAAGAAGVVLDAQLALTRESAAGEEAREAIARMDGSETICVGESSGLRFRFYWKPGAKAAEAVAALQDSREIEQAIAERSGWGPADRNVWILGQDAAFASRLAERHRTVGAIVQAMRRSIDAHLGAARTLKPLASGSPMAGSHGTLYPIVQGPMTRVSDTAEFALEVARGGGLPFLALALLRAAEVRRLLSQTRELLGDRPWGVGILGFVPLELRQEQLDVIREIRPGFALIAGGRPDQALALERDGIPTYLHVPSPGLLDLFLGNGSRRFVFEGRECGGHVGPRSSFVLWNTMVDVLLESLPPGEAGKCHVLFAGGIHDPRSAAMVSALAAPLAERGVNIGVLMGTAYLFTREAVECGAIVEGFQQEAVRCDSTVLLETGPGHATRCAGTAFAGVFMEERRRLEGEGRSPEEIRTVLEEMNLGRLRIASKGIRRRQAPAGASPYEKVEGEEQHAQGMYMIGQVAAARSSVTTIGLLHREVSVAGSEWLDALEQPDLSGGGRRPSQSPCDIAIIGMGCMLPGAPDLSTYWSNILNKVDAITEIPADRWDWRLYYDPDPSAPDKIYSKWGGFLDDHPFDPMRYGMPPNTLPSIEPLQLLTLEVVRAALEDSGYLDQPHVRPRTSVVLGAGGGVADLGSRYGIRAGLPNLIDGVPGEVLEALPEWTEDSFAGILLNVAAGRVANRFDLGGSNFTVDAACASSLAAIYLGIKELESGTSDLVIAGGTDTVQNPFGYLCFSKTRALSPRGRCRTFDATADGIVISEGLAAVVLKRLSDAERDGDRIYAVIKGIASSSDGRDKGLTAPRREGQIASLERAYAKAGFSPSTVGLIEAHGTGTVAGDRAEVDALKSVFDSASTARQSCAIGSVKSMIGHTKCTAGVAGLIKVALALHHKVIPPTLNVTEPNPRAGFPESPFYVSSETRPWIRAASAPTRRAGVSAFGFGGTNFHTVLEEHTTGLPPALPGPVVDRDRPEILLFQGGSLRDLDGQLAAISGALDAGARPRPGDLAFSLWKQVRAQGRAALTMALILEPGADPGGRLARARSLLGASGGEINDPTGIYLSSRPLAAVGKLAFLFPGQGSQYPGMLGDLAVHFPEAREAFEAFDETLAGCYDGALSRRIFPPPEFTPEEKKRSAAELTRTEVAQPALGAAGTAMLRVLDSLGIRPQMAAGHSYGEYVALHAADVIDTATLAVLSEARGRSIIEASSEDLGTMAAVPAGREQVEALIGSREDLWIANLNAPAQTVISGSRAAIEEAVAAMVARGIEARSLPVACAFHSPLVAPARDRLARVLDASEFRPPAFPVFSNTTATAYPEDGRATATLLTEHLVNPVLFADEIEAMYSAGARIFLEAGPRSVLTSLTRQILEGRRHVAISTDQPGRSGLLQLLHALGQLAAQGAAPDLDRLFAGRDVRALRLSALVEETREKPLPPTTWMVNGGRARPLAEVAGPDGRPMKPPAPAPVSLRAAAAAVRAEEPRAAGMLPVEGDDLLARHQQLMDRFLDVHRSVMMSALTGAPPAAEQRQAAAAAPEQISVPVPPPAIDDAAPTEPSAVRTVATAPPAPPATAGREEIARRLLELVGERTGYPPEMLDLEVDMEADLGIDSIKRVEILGVMQKACMPEGRAADPAQVERLNACKSLGAVIDWFQEALAAVPAASAPGTAPEPVPLSVTASGVAAPRDPGPLRDLPRYLLSAIEEIDPAPGERPIATGGVHLITGCDPDLAKALGRAIGSRGGRALLAAGSLESWGDFGAEAAEAAVRSAKEQAGPIVALIHLSSPLPPTRLAEMGLEEWRRRMRAEVKSLFHLARSAAPDLLEAAARGEATLMAVTTLGGAFGLEGGTGANPGSGGLAGLIKTLDHEWPEVRCVALDTDPAADADARAGSVLDALVSGAREPEVGRIGARRFVLRALPQPLGPEVAPAIGSDDVVLVTGGARGITAESILAIAVASRPLFVIAGRSNLPPEEEPASTRGLEGAREIKAALVEEMKSVGGRVQLPEVEKGYARLMADREIRANIGRLRATGSRVEYHAVDVRDEAALGGLIREIAERHGRLDAVVHGAGVIEDKLLLDKTPASFDRVFDTKADSAFILGRHLDLKALKLLVFFASVSGPFGSRGQCDYAAANEVVNRLAASLARGASGRVLSINWGPWATTGMAGEEVQRQFRERGVQVIPPEAGVRMFVRELDSGSRAGAAVVIGGGPWPTAGPAELPRAAGSGRSSMLLPLMDGVDLRHGTGEGLEFTRSFDTRRDLYLTDHQLDGNPVVPAAMAMELMAEAAQRGWPDLTVTGLRDLRVLKGVIVDNGPKPIRLTARAAVEPPHDRLGVDVNVEIVDPSNPTLRHYRATVELTDGYPQPPRYELPFGPDLRPFAMGVDEAYRRYLFHGRLFKGISEIRGVCSRGMVATLTPSTPAQWLAGGNGGGWLIDPVIFDSGLQMVILWARTHLDVTPLPSRFVRYRRYGPLSGGVIRCDLHIGARTSESLFEIDLYFSDAGGRLLGVLEGMECPSSRSFNRLAVKDVSST